jgi:predicted MFS family arabinose efflux permease
LILSVFRVRSFRFQLPADLVTSWAFEMETLILGWFVMVHTGSVLLLTLFASLQFAGTLTSPLFGVLGDRLGGRFMLCAMRATYAGFAALFTILAFTGALTTGRVFVLAGLVGIVRSNDLVMRNWLIGETIPAPLVGGAVGLSRAITDTARITGALVGASLSTALGVGSAYAAVTVLYLAGLALTFGIARRRPVADPAEGPGAAGRPLVRSSGWRDLKEGVAYVLRTPALVAMMWLAFLVNLTAYPATQGLLPYVARTIYQVDARGLGWLVASFSLGALCASATIAVTGGSRQPARFTLVGSALWYAFLLVFAHLRRLELGLAVLFAAGFAQSVAMISMTADLLGTSGDRFRGRVMGVRMLAVYGLPLGLMLAGALIDRLGFPLTVTVLVTTGLGCTVLIGLTWRASLWRRPHRRALSTVPRV